MQNAVNIPKGFLELAPLHQGAGVQEDQAQVSSGVSSWLILWGLFTAPALKLYQHHISPWPVFPALAQFKAQRRALLLGIQHRQLITPVSHQHLPSLPSKAQT